MEQVSTQADQITGAVFSDREDLAQRVVADFRGDINAPLDTEVLTNYLTGIVVADSDFDPARDVDQAAGALAARLQNCVLQLGHEFADPRVVDPEGIVHPESYLYRVFDVLMDRADFAQGSERLKWEAWRDAGLTVARSVRYWYDLGLSAEARCRFEYTKFNAHPARSNPIAQPQAFDGVAANQEIEVYYDLERAEHIIRIVSTRPSETSSDGFDAEKSSDGVERVIVGVDATLLKEQIRRASDGHPIIIRSVPVIGDLDLSNLQISSALRFEKCNFYREPPVESTPKDNLTIGTGGNAPQDDKKSRGVTRANVILRESRGVSIFMEHCVLKRVDAEGLHLSGSLLMNECDIQSVSIERAEIEGHVGLQNLGFLPVSERLAPAGIVDDPDDCGPVTIAGANVAARSMYIDGGHFDVVQLQGSCVRQILGIGRRVVPTKVHRWVSLVDAELGTLIMGCADVGDAREQSGIWANNCRVRSELVIDRECRIFGSVDLSGAKVEGDLAVRARRVGRFTDEQAAALVLDLARVQGAVSLGLEKGRFHSTYDEDVSGGFVSVPRDDDKAVWLGGLDASEARVDGNFAVSKTSMVAGNPKAGHRDLGESIQATGLEVSGWLSFDDVSTDARVVADGIDVDVLRIARCEFNLRTTPAITRCTYGPHVSHVAPAGLSLRSASVRLRGELSHETTIHGDLSLAQATIHDLLVGCDASGPARFILVNGVFHAPGLTVTGQCQLHPEHRSGSSDGLPVSDSSVTRGDQGLAKGPAAPKDGGAPFTRLTNARLVRVEFGPGYLTERSGLVCLVGADFGEFTCAADADALATLLASEGARQTPSSATRPSGVPRPSSPDAKRQKEVQQQIKFMEKLISDYSARGHYHPSPFLAAARVQKSLGREEAAEHFRVLQKRHEREHGNGGHLKRLRSDASYFLTRYGYSFRILWLLLIIFTALALATVLVTAAQGAFVSTEPTSEPGTVAIFPTCSTDYPCFNWFVFLLDTIVPIANFQQADFWQPTGWIVPTVLGTLTVTIWALSILLIASVSNHAKKPE